MTPFPRWFTVSISGELHIWTTGKRRAVKEAKAAFDEQTIGPEDLEFKATEAGHTMPKGK